MRPAVPHTQNTPHPNAPVTRQGIHALRWVHDGAHTQSQSQKRTWGVVNEAMARSMPRPSSPCEWWAPTPPWAEPRPAISTWWYRAGSIIASVENITEHDAKRRSPTAPHVRVHMEWTQHAWMGVHLCRSQRKDRRQERAVRREQDCLSAKPKVLLCTPWAKAVCSECERLVA